MAYVEGVRKRLRLRRLYKYQMARRPGVLPNTLRWVEGRLLGSVAGGALRPLTFMSIQKPLHERGKAKTKTRKGGAPKAFKK